MDGGLADGVNGRAGAGGRGGIDDWQAFWIDGPARSLYAALHPVAGTPGTGVVIVPPLVDELPRSRRFVTEMAGELAAAGLPALRFDFHGTGDSSGEGGELDFESMRIDLGLAIAALRARTRVSRVAVLALRGSALFVDEWVAKGGTADLLVLWEPLPDGAAWLRELVDADAGARAILPPPRPGVPRTGSTSDGQLMGFRVSPRLRDELAGARLGTGLVRRPGRTWAVLRAGDASPEGFTRLFPLPASAPAFSGGVSMDATLFLAPAVRALVRELGSGMREAEWA